MSLLDIAQLELDFLRNINTLKAFKKQTCTEHNFFFFFFPPPCFSANRSFQNNLFSFCFQLTYLARCRNNPPLKQMVDSKKNLCWYNYNIHKLIKN